MVMGLKKLCSLVLIVTLVFLVGCSTASNENTVKEEQAVKGEKTAKEEMTVMDPAVNKNIVLPKSVKIGVINTKALPPQVVYGFSKDIYKQFFPTVNFELDLSEGHHDVAMNLADSNWDFAYLSTGPSIEFSNYGFQKWKPAEYTILAGAQYYPSVLMAAPTINSIKDLDGKTVGFTNKNHDKEMVLNNLLAKVGLKTEALGGTVKVKYEEPAEVYNDLRQGKIQAAYPMPSGIQHLKQANFKVLSDGTDSDYGKRQPGTVFAVSNNFLKSYPDFVKEMVKLHIYNTQLALANNEEMLDLTYKLETDYFKNDMKRVIPKNQLAILYKQNKTTYDPNIGYLQASHKFLQDAKYIKAMPSFDNWANFTFLNEILKEKGLQPIK